MTHEFFYLICSIWSITALLIFILLQFVTAPYGRHFQHGWGLEIGNRLGWVLMESPSFFIMFYFFMMKDHQSYTNVLFLVWLGHYLNRTFIFPFRIHTKDKKMPLAILVSAVFFNTINAGLNGYFLSELSYYQSSDFLSWHFPLGLGLFIIGFTINQWSDHILIGLRKGHESAYKIPRGYLFRYISCPNLSGEIIEWTGFALMAWSFPALTFLLWTLANLVPRAIKHHQWYLDHFADYPTERKALIPKIL